MISTWGKQVEIMSDSVRVAVIGAGISGVVTAGHLLAAGIQVSLQCFSVLFQIKINAKSYQTPPAALFLSKTIT
jgi:NADH dehydrogenase FAD-containing subunit